MTTKIKKGFGPKGTHLGRHYLGLSNGSSIMPLVGNKGEDMPDWTRKKPRHPEFSWAKYEEWAKSSDGAEDCRFFHLREEAVNELLSRMHPLNRVSNRDVEAYKENILMGLWSTNANGLGIMFDKQTCCGRTRLTAFSRACEEIRLGWYEHVCPGIKPHHLWMETMVAINLPFSALVSDNGGRKHSPVDAVRASGLDGVTAHQVRVGRRVRFGIERRRNDTDTTQTCYYRNYRDYVDAAVSIVSKQNGQEFKYLGFSNSKELGAVVCRAMMTGVSRETCEEFVDIIRTGSFGRTSAANDRVYQSVCNAARSLEIWYRDCRSKDEWRYAAIDLMLHCFANKKEIPALPQKPFDQRVRNASNRFVLSKKAAEVLGVTQTAICKEYQEKFPIN